MAGKVLFDEGPHASRTGYRGEITEADWKALRVATPPYVSDEVLAGLANKIMFAEADAKRGDAYVASRDQLAQLKKLRRLAKRKQDDVVVDADGREHRFTELAGYLANLDQTTFARIKADDRTAIQAVIDDDGVFVDVDGDEHRFMPPATEVVRQWAGRGARVWLPRGIDGFIEAVSAAITELEVQRDAAGRRERPWQGALAKVVIEFWRTHCPSESQSAHRIRIEDSHDDLGSPLVEFARVAFAIAGRRVSASQISDLLNTRE